MLRILIALALAAFFAAPASAQNLNFGGNPAAWHVFMEDFDHYLATSWVVTTTEAGTNSATEELAESDGGIFYITTDTGDADNDFFQWAGGSNTNVIENFTYESDKRLYFAARFKVLDETEDDLVFGLQPTDTAPLAATDGIWFGKDETDDNIDFHVAASSTQTDVTDVCTLESDTWIKLAFYYPADSGDIDIYCDDVRVGSAALTNAPSTDLAVSFGVQNGETGSTTWMAVDYIFVAKER